MVKYNLKKKLNHFMKKDYFCSIILGLLCSVQESILNFLIFLKKYQQMFCFIYVYFYQSTFEKLHFLVFIRVKRVEISTFSSVCMAVNANTFDVNMKNKSEKKRHDCVSDSSQFRLHGLKKKKKGCGGGRRRVDRWSSRAAWCHSE